MKKTLFIALCALLCVGAQAQGQDATKNISSSFATSSTPTLNVNSKFGNVEIVSSPKSSVEVTVNITTEAQKESVAQQMLGCIDVKTTKSGDVVSIETHIDDKAIRTIVGNNNNRSYNVKIFVKTPTGTSVNVDNQYGNVQINQIKGAVNSKVKFGNFRADDLVGASKINTQYGNVDIGTASDLDLRIHFGNSSIDKAANIAMTSSYGNHKFGNVTSLTAGSQFDKYTITSAGAVTFSKCQYTNVNVGELGQSISIGQMSFGSLKIDNVARNFTKIDVKASYSGIKIGFDAPAAFSANLRNTYGSILANSLDGSITNLNTATNSTSYTLSVGGSTDQKVTVTNSFANIELIKNR